MKTIILNTIEERGPWTHLFKVLWSDFTTAGATQTLTLLPGVIAGDRVRDAGFFLKTPFSGGSGTNLTLQLGYTGTVAGLIAAAEINLAGTEILAGDATGSDFATLRTGKAFVAASAIEALFTATGANINTLTAGELYIVIQFSRLSTLA